MKTIDDVAKLSSKEASDLLDKLIKRVKNSRRDELMHAEKIIPRKSMAQMIRLYKQVHGFKGANVSVQIPLCFCFEASGDTCSADDMYPENGIVQDVIYDAVQKFQKSKKYEQLSKQVIRDNLKLEALIENAAKTYKVSTMDIWSVVEGLAE